MYRIVELLYKLKVLEQNQNHISINEFDSIEYKNLVIEKNKMQNEIIRELYEVHKYDLEIMERSKKCLH